MTEIQSFTTDQYEKATRQRKVLVHITIRDPDSMSAIAISGPMDLENAIAYITEIFKGLKK